jgi:hypothetical protein
MTGLQKPVKSNRIFASCQNCSGETKTRHFGIIFGIMNKEKE